MRLQRSNAGLFAIKPLSLLRFIPGWHVKESQSKRAKG
jgi:hypothetical protein